MKLDKVNLEAMFARIDAPWQPKIVGELNGQYVKLAKFEGEYVWHHHEDEDELFLVVDGEIDLHFRDETLHLEQGELAIVPRGVEHKPEAKDGARVLLFEPISTRNTGNVDHEYTIEAADLERLV